MRPEDADRLAALDEERLVLAEAEQAPDNCTQGFVTSRRATRAAVDDELLRPLGGEIDAVAATIRDGSLIAAVEDEVGALG